MTDKGRICCKPARGVPALGECDVVGGGSAGCAAAIAAARGGAEVLLVKKDGRSSVSGHETAMPRHTG
ncbi:MAG: FAD-dependent oxidoreductase [Phycisphaerae bacterium]|nr:FAD-dependent oxidoreductase [Phycisphaerae bacterium]